MLSIRTNQARESRYLKLRLKGALDGISAREFRWLFEELLSKRQEFVLLDLGELEYLSSAGIGALLDFGEKLKEKKGALALFGLNTELGLLFRFFAIDRRLAVFEGEEEAQGYLLEELKKRPAEVESSYAKYRRDAKRPSRERESGEIPEVEARPSSLAEELESLRFPRGAERETRQSPSVHPRKEPPVPFGPVDENVDFFTGKFAKQSPSVSCSTKYFRTPLLGNCCVCGLALRFYHSGAHLCPGCGEENFVAPNGRIENQGRQTA